MLSIISNQGFETRTQAAAQASLHPCNDLRFVTLNFRSLPLDCCISCLLQSFHQASMANCIMSIGVNDENLPEHAPHDWMQNIPVVLKSRALGCALNLSMGRLKHPQISLYFLDRLLCWIHLHACKLQRRRDYFTNAGKVTYPII